MIVKKTLLPDVIAALIVGALVVSMMLGVRAIFHQTLTGVPAQARGAHPYMP